MKKRIVCVFFLLSLVFSSCSRTPAVGSDTVAEERGTIPLLTETEEASLTQTDTDPPIPLVTTAAPPVSTTLPASDATEKTNQSSQAHTHTWKVSSITEANCSANGVRVYSCSCGQSKEEVLLSLPHDFASRGCGKRFQCKKCGCEGELAKHRFEKNVCSLCDLVVSSPVFVCNTQLDYDEPAASVIQKMGKPTEVLSEGELKSLVYASDPTCLTVIQTDSVGLWGVFTLDPNAFFYIDGQIVKAEGFSGKPDTQSDTSYREFGSCRVYGFRDQLGSKKYYGMWLRYTECEYHYLTDPRITPNYEAQEKLSYYYVNALRAINGKQPLGWCELAAQVSREYSVKMANENFFAHDGLYANRLSSAGVVWRSCGENVSQGYTSAYFVCDAYYNCADHRSNILNSAFTHVGMGFAIQKDGEFPVSVLGTQTFYS